ncbi:MAG TPA: zinc ribbon domain-containing protein [Bryobacteraceae bacterium]|jgi:uncharacterized membrane protein|nr:zinc ribbon domain-containing protein [Bryobacteraceae bacterium]
MPFCTACGNKVGDRDTFCAHCGTRQTVSTPPSFNVADPLASLTPRTISILCYIPVFGWIVAILALANPKFHSNRVVRFHAFQGLYLFVVWLLVDWVVAPFLGGLGPESAARIARGLLKASVFVGWLIMLVKTSQNEDFRLPILGELADRSMNEQR